MSLCNTNSGSAKLPEGYVAIPVAENQKAAVLKICVLVKPEADPVAGHLVVLRDTLDAKVLLGCIIDTAGRVHQWIELWIQDATALIAAVSGARQSLSNAVLDDRWRRQCRMFEQLAEAATVKAAWESEPPLPTFLDLSEHSPVHPVEADSGAPWTLCMDEGLLQQKGLPSYGSSLHRYLYVPALGSDSQFIPVTPGAPTNDSTRPMSEIGGDPTRVVPLNPHAGLMLVKKHAPIGLETFVDILSGAAWDGLKHGRSVLHLGEQIKALRKDETALTADGRLLLETHGRCGRLVETFHLKLRLLADIISSVHSAVRHLQRPLLNIAPDSWQVGLGEPGRGLPFLWTAKAVLSDPGEAIALAVEGSDLQYYLPSPAAGTSVYRPLVTTLSTKGRASVRIRGVLSKTGEPATVEGTFATQERIEMVSHDLAWLRLNLASGGIDLYAHLESDAALAAGEWRFRTVAQGMKDTEVTDLQAAAGVPMPEVPFEVIPLLSSPCDLYSLAVLAIRILLVDNTNSLPVVLDETLSLAREVEADYDESVSLQTRISNIFSRDKRWPESLGPHHLTFDEITAEDALRVLPAELWWATLAMVLRMFPGLGPDSECKDYGDAPPGGLHRVFERTMAELDQLIFKTRSLIVPDAASNQEIAAVVQKYLT